MSNNSKTLNSLVEKTIISVKVLSSIKIKKIQQGTSDKQLIRDFENLKNHILLHGIPFEFNMVRRVVYRGSIENLPRDSDLRKPYTLRAKIWKLFLGVNLLNLGKYLKLLSRGEFFIIYCKIYC